MSPGCVFGIQDFEPLELYTTNLKIGLSSPVPQLRSRGKPKCLFSFPQPFTSGVLHALFNEGNKPYRVYRLGVKTGVLCYDDDDDDVVVVDVDKVRHSRVIVQSRKAFLFTSYCASRRDKLKGLQSFFPLESR